MLSRTFPILIVILWLSALAGAQARAGELSGRWEFTFLGYTLSAQLEQRGESIQGVAYLYSPLGARDTYHFTGTLRDGAIVASHYTGHTFRGQVISLDEMTGVLHTRDGEEMCITVHRRGSPMTGPVLLRHRPC